MKKTSFPRAITLFMATMLAGNLYLPSAHASEPIAVQSAAVKPMDVPAAKTATAASELADDDEFEEADDAWLWVPMHGTMSRTGLTKAGAVVRLDTSKVLEASIDFSDGDQTINSQINSLTKNALLNNSKMIDAKEACDHFSTVGSKTAVKSKDALNILIAYRGFASSKEAGDILLDEKLRLNGLPAAELAMQKELDKTSTAIVESLMQIAMGFGLKDDDKQTEIIAEGYKSLSDLVGAEMAQDSVNTLANWKKRIRMPEAAYKNLVWSPTEQKEKLKLIETEAAAKDAIIAKVTKKMHGYNKKSKAAMAAGHVIEGGLGIACLVPTAVGPAAQIALTGFEMATGGSEENKLLKQIYLSKRLESRSNLIKSKASLALQNYQMAMMTKNPALLAISESIVAQMTSDDVAKKVFGDTLSNMRTAALNTDGAVKEINK